MQEIPGLSPEAKATAVRFQLPLTPLAGTRVDIFTGSCWGSSKGSSQPLSVGSQPEESAIQKRKNKSRAPPGHSIST